MYTADTIVPFYRLTIIGVISRGGDIGLVAPGERCRIGAKFNRIFPDVVGLVYTQAEAVNTVAAVYVLHAISVLTRCVERIPGYSTYAAIPLDVFPYIRQVCISDIYRLVRTAGW